MNVLSIFTSQLFLYLPERCVFTRALAGLVLLSVLETGLEKEGKDHLISFLYYSCLLFALYKDLQKLLLIIMIDSQMGWSGLQTHIKY